MRHETVSCDYCVPAILLRFLGECVYGDAGACYAGLDETGRAMLKKQGRSFGLSAWFYRYLYDILPEKEMAEYRNPYQMRQVKAMMGAHELKHLYGVLKANDLRFVPIKGADLAYRLYPDAALRVFGDWDIWFHPDDCERALAVLADDAWKVPENYSDDHEAVRASGAHHFSGHIRGQFKLEPHFALSNFNHIDLYEMWEHTLEYPAGDGQRVLSPEMNLLMLARHAASQSYCHAQVPKLLTDAAMVMQKEKVDFARLRALADHWHLPYPGDLLAAFPEFFPAAEIEKMDADPARTDAFRSVFEVRCKLGKPKSIALFLSRYEARGHLAGGVLGHIRRLTPDRIRLIYRLPKHGAWIRVIWSYVCWFWTRSLRAAAWIRRDRDLKRYGRLVESIESEHRFPSKRVE